MVKLDLINKLAEMDIKFPLKVLAKSVNCILQDLSDGLVTKKRIEIRDFGSFSLNFRQSRNARNPKTGEEITTPSRYYIHFKPGKELKERVMQNREKAISE